MNIQITKQIGGGANGWSYHNTNQEDGQRLTYGIRAWYRVVPVEHPGGLFFNGGRLCTGDPFPGHSGPHSESLVASTQRGWGGGGGQLGQFAPVAPSVRGAPNSAELFQIRSCPSWHPSLASLRGSFRWNSSQPAFLLHAHTADANFKIMHTLI